MPDKAIPPQAKVGQGTQMQHPTQIPTFTFQPYTPPPDAAPTYPAPMVQQTQATPTEQFIQRQIGEFDQGTPVRNIAQVGYIAQALQWLRSAPLDPQTRALIGAQLSEFMRQQAASAGISQGTYDFYDLRNNPHAWQRAQTAERDARTAMDQAMQDWARRQGLTAQSRNGKTSYYKSSGELFGDDEEVRRRSGLAWDPTQSAGQQAINARASQQMGRQQEFNTSLDQMLREGSQWMDQKSRDDALRGYTGEHFNRLRSIGIRGQ